MQKTLRAVLRRAMTLLLKKPMKRQIPMNLQRTWLNVANGITRTAPGTRGERGTWWVRGLWVRHRDGAWEDDRGPTTRGAARGLAREATAWCRR